MRSGVEVMAEVTGDPRQPVSYTFADDGATARSDVIERLIADGVLTPRGDGLFAEFSQTYGLAQ